MTTAGWSINIIIGVIKVLLFLQRGRNYYYYFLFFFPFLADEAVKCIHLPWLQILILSPFFFLFLLTAFRFAMDKSCFAVHGQMKKKYILHPEVLGKHSLKEPAVSCLDSWSIFLKLITGPNSTRGGISKGQSNNVHKCNVLWIILCCFWNKFV